MTRLTKIICFISLVIMASISNAEDGKLGFVDRQVLESDSLYAKSIHERMKQEFEGRQDTLAAKEKDLLQKIESLERDREVLSSSEVAKRERELTSMRQTIVDAGEEFRQDVMRRKEKEAIAFNNVLKEVLATVAKDKKLDNILQNQAALYTASKSDYTYEVLKAMDKHYKENNPKK